MTIEIKEGRFFSRMWFIPGDGVDWMGALWRDDGTGSSWIGQYRFRYYAGPSLDAGDEKSWFKVLFDSNEKNALAAFAQVIAEISKHLQGEVHTLILNTSDPKKVLEAVQREKFCHIKKLEEEPT